MHKLAHIVNPVVVKPTSDLYTAQPIAFESMQTAQKMAQTQGIEVELFSAQYAEDRRFAAQYFQPTPDLGRSVLDVGQFAVQRKLPLLKDILDALYEHAPEADYLIYTNADITLVPHFYVSLSQLLQQYDAFVVNRRTISKQYDTPAELPLMYAEVGQPHRGHDCFIFSRTAYPSYRLDHVCVGISLVGMALLVNLISNAAHFRQFKDFHLTFHLGNDAQWRSDKFDDYTLHNLQAVNRIVDAYQAQGDLAAHPLIDNFLAHRDPDYWTKRPQRMPPLQQRIKQRIKKSAKRSLKRLLP